MNSPSKSRDRDTAWEKATEPERHLLRVEAERKLRMLREEDVAAGPPQCVKCGVPSLAWGRCIEHLAEQATTCPESRLSKFFVSEGAGRALKRAADSRGVSTCVVAAEVIEEWARRA